MKKLVMLLFLALFLISCSEVEDTYDGVYQVYDSNDNIVNENWYIQILDNTWISYEVNEGNMYVQIPNIDKCLRDRNSKFYKKLNSSVSYYNRLDESKEYMDLKNQVNIFYHSHNYENYEDLVYNLNNDDYMSASLIQWSFYEIFEMKELYYFGYHEVEMTSEGLKIGSSVAQYESGVISFEDATGATAQLKRVRKL